MSGCSGRRRWGRLTKSLVETRGLTPASWGCRPCGARSVFDAYPALTRWVNLCRRCGGADRAARCVRVRSNIGSRLVPRCIVRRKMWLLSGFRVRTIAGLRCRVHTSRGRTARTMYAASIQNQAAAHSRGFGLDPVPSPSKSKSRARTTSGFCGGSAEGTSRRWRQSSVPRAAPECTRIGKVGLESDKQFQTSGRASDEAWSSTITSKSSDEARHTASLAPRAVHTSNPAFCSVIGEIVQAPGRTVDAQNAVCRVGHGDTLLPVEGPPGMHSLEQLTRFFVKTL